MVFFLLAVSGCATNTVDTDPSHNATPQITEPRIDVAKHRLPIFEELKDQKLLVRSKSRISRYDGLRYSGRYYDGSKAAPVFWTLLTAEPKIFEIGAHRIVSNQAALGLRFAQENNYLAVEDIGDLEYQHLPLEGLPQTPDGGVGVRFKLNADNTIKVIDVTYAHHDPAKAQAEILLWAQLLSKITVRHMGSKDGTEATADTVYTSNLHIDHLPSVVGRSNAEIQPAFSNYKAELSSYAIQIGNLEQIANHNAYRRKIAQQKMAIKEAEKERIREREMQWEKARLAKQEAARKHAAYLKTPAGKAELAARKARLKDIEKSKLARRKAEGWPSNAVGKIAEGVTLCSSYKSGVRAYMIERSGNPYASVSSDCSYSPSALFLSEVTTMPSGVAKVYVIGGGYFFVNPNNVDG